MNLVPRPWRHPWQVVRVFHDGSVSVMSSHRWQGGAAHAAALRDAFGRSGEWHHDYRRTPQHRRWQEDH